MKRLLLVVLLILVAGAVGLLVLIEPFGPVSQTSYVSFQFEEQSSVNVTRLDELDMALDKRDIIGLFIGSGPQSAAPRKLKDVDDLQSWIPLRQADFRKRQVSYRDLELADWIDGQGYVVVVHVLFEERCFLVKRTKVASYYFWTEARKDEKVNRKPFHEQALDHVL